MSESPSRPAGSGATTSRASGSTFLNKLHWTEMGRNGHELLWSLIMYTVHE